MASSRALAARLTPGYRPPYDLDLSDDAAIRALDESGSARRYVILTDGTCTVDGEAAQHPFTKIVGGDGSLEDWVDGIALAHGAGLRARGQGAWADPSIEASVRRAQHGIVAWDEQELAPRSLDELAGWLDRVLSGSPIELTATALPDLTGADAEAFLLRRIDDGETTGWLPIAAGPGTRERLGPQPRTHASARASGASLLWHAADGAIAQSTLPVGGGTVAGWAVIGVRGTDIALPLELSQAHVRVRVDDDGAMVHVSVEPAECCEAEHRRRAAFERQWGPWLDPSMSLSAADLRDGVARAEEAFDAMEDTRGGHG